MTEQQQKILMKYQRQILTASKAKYYVGLGQSDIRAVIDLHNELFPNQKETFTTCSACVLKILQKLYRPMQEAEVELNKPKEEEEKPKAPKKGKGNGKKTDQ